MGTSLINGANSQYIAAQNVLRSRKAKPEVYIYVEGKDDISFWTKFVAPYRHKFSFQIRQMRIPDVGMVIQGKGQLFAAVDLSTLGPNKLIAVDADYDWIMDSYCPSAFVPSISEEMRENPYILHTYLYSIENYKCYPDCVEEMVVKASNECATVDFCAYFHSFSDVMANLFLIHLTSMELCDGVYTIRDFGRDMDRIKMDFDTMEVTEASKAYITDREESFAEYCFRNSEVLDKYRNRFWEYGFAREDFYLFFQGHLVADIMVRKYLPNIIRKARKGVLKEIRENNNREQAEQELRQYEKLTGISRTNGSAAIAERVNQLIYDCTDISRAHKGYIRVMADLNRLFT